MIKYYRIEETSTTFRTRDEGIKGYWIERLDNGKWVDDPDLLKYIFDGEPGAEELSAAKAAALPK